MPYFQKLHKHMARTHGLLHACEASVRGKITKSENASVEWISPATGSKSNLPVMQLSGLCLPMSNGIDISCGTDVQLLASDDAQLVPPKLNKIVIGAWFDGRAPMALAHCDDTHAFSVQVCVPPDAPDVLKIASYMDITDPETGMRKLFPLQTCGVSVHELADSKLHIVSTCDAFNPMLQTMLHLTMHSAPPLSTFRPSALASANKYMQAIAEMQPTISQLVQAENISVPRSLVPYMDGVTFAPFVGIPSMRIPPMPLHYSLLGTVVNNLDRQYPPAVPVYFVAMTCLQSPHSLADLRTIVRAGPVSHDFVNLVADCVTGFTHDAMCMAYQRDATPALMCMDLLSNPHIGLTITTSEDINFTGYAASLACEADTSVLQGCAAPDLPQANSTGASKVRACKREFALQPWPQMSRSFGKDDCESSSINACIIFNTIRHGNWAEASMRADLGSLPMFAQFTPDTWSFLSEFFTTVQQHIRAQTIHITPVIGLAGAASAQNGGAKAQWDPNSMEGGGHCFGVMRFIDHKNKRVQVRIIEGTNAVLFMRTPDVPTEYKVNVHKNADGSMSIPDAHGADCTVSCDDHVKFKPTEFATVLSKLVSSLTQVCVPLQSEQAEQEEQAEQQEKSAAALPAGWVCCNGQCNYGMIRSQIAMDQHDPVFYLRCMYAGYATGSENAAVATPTDTTYGYIFSGECENVRYVGCSAAELDSDKLLALPVNDAIISADAVRIGCACMNEVWPPMASADTFHQIMGTWAALPPLETRHAPGATRTKYQRPGVRYTTICSYESPMSPLLVDLSFVAKQELVRRANEINSALSDSDGIFFEVQRTGTGSVVVTHIPVGLQSQPEINVTAITSLKQACAETGFHQIV